MTELALKVGVVGSGLMGKGLVQFLASSKCVEKVFWKSGHGTSLVPPFESIQKNVANLARKNKITDEEANCLIGKIYLCTDFNELNECSIVHEAISEDLQLKAGILSILDHELNNNIIIASNTSSLSITELGFSTKRPENIIGMHFFNPAPIMKLVEIIPGIATNKTVKEFVLSYAEKLGKIAVEVEESPGFIVNRLLIPMINEAICILAEHVASKESIDSAMKHGANHPIGPLALADLIGNDVVLSIMEVLYKETGDQKYRPHPLLRKMVRAGQFGKKSASGFYEY